LKKAFGCCVLALSLPVLGAPSQAGPGGCPWSPPPLPDAAALAAMDQPTGGTRIHLGEREGRTFLFETLPPGAPPATHQLAVTVRDPAKKPYYAGMVAFFLTGPDGKERKVVTRRVGTTFRADVDWSARGRYTVLTRTAGPDGDVEYTFDYEVK